MTTTMTKPKPAPTDLDRVVRDQAIALYNKTGDGFIMHMNNSTTLCRQCVSRKSPAIFNTLLNWSRENKEAACFADLYTKDTGGHKRCSLCNQPFSLHNPPPPLSVAVTRMSRNHKAYSFSLYNQTVSISILPQ